MSFNSWFNRGMTNFSVPYIDTDGILKAKGNLVKFSNITSNISGIAVVSSLSGSENIPIIQNGNIVIVTSQALVSQLDDVTSLKEYGAVGDGIADDTIPIQNALNSGFKKIISDRGKVYRITDTLTIDTDNLTLDLSRSQIKMDDASGIKNHIQIGNGVTKRNGIVLRDIIWGRSQAATSGSAIYANYVGVLEISKQRMYGENKIFRGITLNRAAIVNIYDSYFQSCLDDAVYLVGTGTGDNRTVDVTFYNNRIESCYRGLVTSDYVEGLFVRENILWNITNNGMHIDATNNANGLVSFKFHENDFDTCGGYGLYIDKVSNLQVQNNWFSNNSNTCLYIGSLVDAAIVSGNQIYGKSGIDSLLIGGNANKILDNLFSGGNVCIRVNSTATRTTIIGNDLSNAAYGIDTTSNPVGVTILDNNYYLLTSGTFTDNSSPNTRIIKNNTGDTVVGTPASISVGASPFTYTSSPRPECISIYSGNVSNITIGGSVFATQTNTTIVLPPQTSIVITYSVAPTMIRIRL